VDKNRLVLVGAQVVVFVTMAVLVALGHDSIICDAMIAIAGSIAGTGAYQAVKSSKSPANEPE
jgi:hypothetical protein